MRDPQFIAAVVRRFRFAYPLLLILVSAHVRGVSAQTAANTAFSGLGPFACTAPRYETTLVPPQGLFQGGLPEPAAAAAAAARSLGFAAGSARGMSLTCSTGIFEFHLVDPMHLLVAIDNVIWTLDRSPGAQAAASTPEGVVQRLLEKHFAGSMGFDRASTARVKPFLSDAFAVRIEKYFAMARPANEVPPIDGDVFTNSQEYPTRFSVQRGTIAGTSASVVVKFADGYAATSLKYLLRSNATGWRVDDIAYGGGSTLAGQLAAPSQTDNAANQEVPAWAELAWRKESLARGLVRDSAVLPVVQVADFDGDGQRDVALLVRHRTTRSRGVLIVHASGRAAQQCGAGVMFGNGGDNFDWMDTWKVVPSRSGKGSSLLVAKEESASGRIEFQAGRYRWVQVGD